MSHSLPILCISLDKGDLASFVEHGSMLTGDLNPLDPILYWESIMKPKSEVAWHFLWVVLKEINNRIFNNSTSSIEILLHLEIDIFSFSA